MSGLDLDALVDRLGERDLAVLRSVEQYRLLGTGHVQRLHFAEHHDSQAAATRACVRVLGRLREHGLLACLTRRVGGVRSGSAGFVWHLGPAGERLLRNLNGQHQRRRYVEPSSHFVTHTLAVAELAVTLTEAARHGRFELARVEAEPRNWLQYLNPVGVRQWLKPDLAVVTTSGDFEDHWFIEADLDTEHLPVVLRQCQAYQSYQASGRYQATHGLFPVVLWVVPSTARAAGIRRAIDDHPRIDGQLFRVCTTQNFLGHLTGASDGSGPPA
jgi:hypothetical protein